MDEGEKPIRILVVEDDLSVLAGLSMNLNYEGYEVLQAQDGKQGLERARLLVTVAPDTPKAGGRGGGIWSSALAEPVVTSPGEFASAPARCAP